ncbi:MAG: DUF72 domain-containing protein [Balneolaceae bacterium]|nr:MAG: DUF72 domain-containing protein [Balneolaceae bacterium]
MYIKKYHIGLTQWGFKEWTNTFFSRDAKPDQFLQQYASVFNSVEGNTTFYRVPTAETVLKWGDQVPDNFKFCFKFPQRITHYKRLKDVHDDVLSFLELFNPIRTKLGPFHIQLSSQYSFNEFDKLETLIELLPNHFTYALELRHPDYFDKSKKEHHLTSLLKSYGINRVVFDTRKLHSITMGDASIKEAQRKKPKTPIRFHSTGVHPFIRFVGANDILNNEAYLKEWAIIIADWIKDSKHPYIFIHAPNTLHAPMLARFFHEELSKLIDVSPMPEWPAERENKQLGLF